MFYCCFSFCCWCSCCCCWCCMLLWYIILFLAEHVWIGNICFQCASFLMTSFDSIHLGYDTYYASIISIRSSGVWSVHRQFLPSVDPCLPSPRWRECHHRYAWHASWWCRVRHSSDRRPNQFWRRNQWRPWSCLASTCRTQRSCSPRGKHDDSYAIPRQKRALQQKCSPKGWWT